MATSFGQDGHLEGTLPFINIGVLLRQPCEQPLGGSFAKPASSQRSLDQARFGNVAREIWPTGSPVEDDGHNGVAA